jgi:CRISPR/Cas system-associated protein Csm6
VIAVEDEYDFSGAERGKFYRKDAVFIPPIQLEPSVLRFLLKRAQAKGATLDELVNELLKKDIELIEAAS